MSVYFLSPQSLAAILSAGVALISASVAWLAFSSSRKRQLVAMANKRDSELLAIDAELKIASAWAEGAYPNAEEAKKSFIAEHPSQKDPTFRILPFKVDAIRTCLSGSSENLSLIRHSTIEAIARFYQSSLSFLDSVAEVERFRANLPDLDLLYALKGYGSVPAAQGNDIKRCGTLLRSKYAVIHVDLIGDETNEAGLHSTYMQARRALDQEMSHPLVAEGKQWILTSMVIAVVLAVFGVLLSAGALSGLLPLIFY